MNIILVEVCERDITVEQFPTVEEAQKEMLKRYVSVALREEYERTRYATMPFQDCFNEVSEHLCDSDSHLNAMSAWVSDGPNHDNYDWKIERLESKKKPEEKF